MVNIGLLGDVSVGKTSILRLFVRYLKKGDIENVEGGAKCSVVKADFSGEATVPGGDKEDARNEKETKTIHPNRIVFREDTTNKAHTIFAPGGDRQRSVVRMGIITISRISTEIIGVFALDRDIDPQLDFFSDVRFFPDKIHVCLNKIDLIENFGEKELENVKKKITDFFEKRRVKVEDFFITCGEIIEGFEDVESYNNKVPEMILSIVSQKT